MPQTRRTRVRTIEWNNGRVVMIDQRLLPSREVYRVYTTYREVARAIKEMVIRGAPAIGVAAAMGIALGVRSLRREELRREFDRICRTFAATRPTAINVFCTETRPFLQGARLTAWELKKDHIPATLITDNMVGHFMKAGAIDCVVVGTDRTAANGDVANKIGTYTVAVLAHRHGIPFYVAAPTSSIDLGCPRGSKIPIEERDSREVTHIFDRQIAPSGIKVANPAFDVTPHDLVTAIITERGIARPPYWRSLPRVVRGELAKAEDKHEPKSEPRSRLKGGKRSAKAGRPAR